MTKSELKQTNKLFEKLAVGPLELPNRIIFGSHPTNFAKNNLLTEQHAAYYETRARGGAGLIILEELLVHPSDLPYEKALFGYREEIVRGCRLVADAIHKHGSLAVAQLNHSGMQSEGSTGMHELWAPSNLPDVVSREVPKAMEPEDIQAVVEGFARAAAHTVQGGLDGVEINAAQFSLLRQFMSPLTNYRTDAYGGELNNRLRLTKEVLQAVRQVLGSGKLLGLRMCADEFAPWGGLTPQDSAAIARELAELNLIDFLTVTVGSLYSLHLTPATHYAAEGLAAAVAADIKKAVNIPVFAEGRIHRPQYAQSIVEQGLVDAVCMNRALIADPELPVKTAAGREDRVRNCLSCNQGCQVRRSMGKPLSCLVNPLAGVEGKGEKGRPSLPKAKQVLVIGGGPAGMEAAAAAAKRGHQVTLWEAGSQLGGQLKANGDKVEYLGLIKMWQRMLDEYKVQVVTGKEANVDQICAAKPDAVILATGSQDGNPPVEPVDCPCCSAREALQGDLQGKTILFWDEIGDQLMGRTVEKLQAAGNKIYFVTPDFFAGNKLAATGELAGWNPSFMSGSAGSYTLSKIDAINGSTAVINHIFGGMPTTISTIDIFVYNSWPQPNDSLYEQLLGRVKEIHRIGDCLAPRGIGPAVREGLTVGKSI